MAPASKGARKSAKNSPATGRKSKGFSDEEKAAMRETVGERKVVWGKNRSEDERLVLAKIGEFPEPDRSMARGLHAVIQRAAPNLSPRLWYGMPAYSMDGDLICWYQNAAKFKSRYGMLGFSDKAKLDEGAMWPTVYAVTELTAAEEAKIVELVKRAVG